MSKTKRLLISMLTLLCCTGAWAEGELKGLFTINASGDKVQFSQGNLQYFCSTTAPEWRFAEHQYDYVEFDGSAYSENSEKWIDLFGYGTSGYNNGQTCYQPYSTTENSSYYYTNNLTGNADWGYNAISNGGNTENSGWRTLTKAEWEYLFSSRTNAASKYGQASINGVNGMILLPDNWTLPDGLSFTPGNHSWATNTYTIDQWTQMENAGAVFLPASGSRAGNLLPTAANENGLYRSSTAAYYLCFKNTFLEKCTVSYYQYGDAVRLVKDYTLQQDAEGNYLIGSVDDWKLFATLVQTTPTANAKMTADIDLGDDQTMVGSTSGNSYQGTFDGQGHTLTVNYNSTIHGIAPFQHVGAATISNLHVDGSIVTTGCGAGGIVSKISGNLTVSRCWVSATLQTASSGGYRGTIGGIVSYCEEANCSIVIEDCVFTGIIVNTEMCGGLMSHLWNGSASVTMRRCLNVGTNTGANSYNYTFIRDTGAGTGTQNLETSTLFYKTAFGNAQGTQATAAQLSDGTTTTALNNERAEEVWVQDLVTNQPMLAIFANVVTLTDGDDLTALLTRAGKTCQVNYSRSFTAGKSSTVCLPFAFAKGSVGTFYTFTGISKSGDDYIADMTEYTGANLVANTPYLFTPSATGSVDFSGTYEIPASITAGETVSGDWTYQGTYETIEWTTAPTGIYGFSAQAVAEQGISQGQFVKVGEYVRVKPMRCYLKYKNGTENYAKARGMNHTSDTDEPLPDVIKVRLIGADGHVTAIGTLQTKTGEVMLNSDVWYTLNGIRIKGKPTVKGVYVNNGKKVAIK